MKLCRISDCENKHEARGYCHKHYRRWERYGNPYAIAYKPSVWERFWSKVGPRNDGECWLWKASLRAGSGYGQFRYNGTMGYAHRFIYEQTFGPIPDDMQVDHLCRVRHCVNPAHMELVSQTENVLRGVGPTAVNARKTVCKRGHALTSHNVYTNPRGYRECRTCKLHRFRGWAAINRPPGWRKNKI